MVGFNNNNNWGCVGDIQQSIYEGPLFLVWYIIWYHRVWYILYYFECGAFPVYSEAGMTHTLHNGLLTPLFSHTSMLEPALTIPEGLGDILLLKCHVLHWNINRNNKKYMIDILYKLCICNIKYIRCTVHNM